MSNRQQWEDEETDQLLHEGTSNGVINGTSNGYAHGTYHYREEEEEEYDGARNAQLSTLYFLCSKSPEDEPRMWEQVRQWLLDHTPRDIRDATVLQGSYGVTALHLVCQKDGPMDILTTLLQRGPAALEMIDSFGWLPLHYATTNGASDKLIEAVVEAYPQAVDIGDKRGRVPLHFAIHHYKESDEPDYSDELSVDCAKALITSVSVDCKDENGMTAMHYVCKYGAKLQVLELIADAVGDSEDHPVDNDGMIPLHHTCDNPYNASSPDLTKFILELYPESVNVFDNSGNLPLRLLSSKVKAESSKYDTSEDLRENPIKILDSYLKAEPNATADFLTALQALPEWLRDRAVVNTSVQDILNHKIAMRFPTAILLADFVLYVAIIVSFSLCVPCSIQLRTLKNSADSGFDEGMLTCTEPSDTNTYVYVLGGSSLYFLLRELAQILSLMSLGLFKTWLYDLTNWLDVMTIGAGLYFAGDMYSNLSDLRRFRWMASFALLFFWAALLSFLKSTFIEFSVFVGGLNNVLNRLLAFLTAMFIILWAFSAVFVIIYFDSNMCTCQGLDCGENYVKFDHFCNNQDSFLKVYTMLLGEVNEEDFLINRKEEVYTQVLGVSLFAVFMFLVVILLANVLIAIVTDSYGVIKNERAAIVFWSNRLDFIAEMDAISYGPWKSKFLGATSVSDKTETMLHDGFGFNMWRTLTAELYQWDDTAFLSLEFLLYVFLRGTILLFIVFLWLPAGLLTAGILWPPQVREFILIQANNKQTSGETRELERRSIEVQALREEVTDLQDEIVHEMTADRMEVIALKAQFGDMKNDLKKEMKEIKTIVSTLFEIQASARSYRQLDNGQ